MPLLYGWATLVISKRAMNKIKAADKKIVTEILNRNFREIDLQNQKDNIAALAALKNQGITFIKPDSKQIAEWKKLAKKGNSELVEKGLHTVKMYKLINKHIADYQKIK